MKRILLAVSAANVAFLGISFMLLPERMAMQFGMDGDPGHLGRRQEYVLAMGLGILVCLAVSWLPSWLIRRTPVSIINVPNKEYWIREENRDEMYRRDDRLMHGFGIAILTFFLWVQALVLAAHYQEPPHLNNGLFLAGLLVFGVYVVYFCFSLLWVFRIPKQGPAE